LISKADFYILEAGYEQEHLNFVCRLVETAWLRQYRIYIHTENEDQSRHIDDLLWNYKAHSFLPHCCNLDYPADLLSQFPVVIGNNGIRNHHDDLLVNLSPTLPDFFNDFNRYSEVVLNLPEKLQQSRDHYRRIQHLKIPVQHHDQRKKQ